MNYWHTILKEKHCKGMFLSKSDYGSTYLRTIFKFFKLSYAFNKFQVFMYKLTLILKLKHYQ